MTETTDKIEPTKGPWYVGAQNDGLFIIDKPPRPAPVDHMVEGNPHGVRVLATICNNDRRAQLDARLMAKARLLSDFHDLWVEHQVAAATGDGDLITTTATALIAGHKVIRAYETQYEAQDID